MRLCRVLTFDPPEEKNKKKKYQSSEKKKKNATLGVLSFLPKDEASVRGRY